MVFTFAGAHEGWVRKRSRHIGQWRERYLILTPRDDGLSEISTYSHSALLSTSAPQPSERIPLSAVESIAAVGETDFAVRSGGVMR